MAATTRNREHERPPMLPIRLPRLGQAPGEVQKHVREQSSETLQKSSTRRSPRQVRSPRQGRWVTGSLKDQFKEASCVSLKPTHCKAQSHDLDDVLHLRHHYKHLHTPVDVMNTRSFQPKYPVNHNHNHPVKGAPSHLADYVTGSSSQTISSAAKILHDNPNVYKESLSKQLSTARHFQSHHRRIEQASTTVDCWHPKPWYSYNKRQGELSRGPSPRATSTIAGSDMVSTRETSPAPIKTSRSVSVSSATSPRISPRAKLSPLPVERMHQLLKGDVEEPRFPLPSKYDSVPSTLGAEPMFQEGTILGATVWEHVLQETVSPRTSPPKRPHWWKDDEPEKDDIDELLVDAMIRRQEVR